MKTIRDPLVNLDPDQQLDDAERADLISLIDQNGFFVLRKLMEIEIKRFDLALKNAEKPEEVIVKHSLAKAASQFYTQLIDRLNQERESFLNAKSLPEILPSITDAITENE